MWYWERDRLPFIDFHTTKEPTARKEHKCEECKKTIEIGSKYRCYSGKFAGEEFFSFKMCLPCCSDWDAVLEIFDENLEPHENAEMVCGSLKAAVRELLGEDFIDESHYLVGKWLPDVKQPKVPSGAEQLSLVLP